MDPTIEKISTNASLGVILVIMAWQLPNIIKLFLEHRKEVAVEMNGQTKAHSETIDKLIAATQEQNEKLIEKFDKRFEKIEEAITTLANTQIQNQEIIKQLLGVGGGRLNEQRPLPAGHPVST